MLTITEGSNENASYAHQLGGAGLCFSRNRHITYNFLTYELVSCLSRGNKIWEFYPALSWGVVKCPVRLIFHFYLLLVLVSTGLLSTGLRFYKTLVFTI